MPQTNTVEGPFGEIELSKRNDKIWVDAILIEIYSICEGLHVNSFGNQQNQIKLTYRRPTV